MKLICTCNFTQQIKTYPATQFEGKTAQFISPYYYEIKARDEDHYNSIVRIFAAGIIFPCVAFIVFGYLVFFYCKWLRTTKLVTMFITNGFSNNNNLEESNNSMNNSETKGAKSRTSIVVSLILVSALLSLTLFAFHIIASVRFIQYGNEVLYDDNDDQGYALRNDDQCVLIVYVVCSFMPTVSLTLFLIIVTIVLCIKSRSSQVDNKTDEALGLFLHYSLGAFLVYLGFYFLPYMVFAFIHDPFQSALVYMMLSSLILSICLFAYFLISVCVVGFLFYQKELSKWDSMSRLLTSGFTFASGLSITYFLTVLILIITLGNLHDFQGMENLTLSLFIALLSLFLLKPSLVHIKSFLEKSPTNDDSS